MLVSSISFRFISVLLIISGTPVFADTSVVNKNSDTVITGYGGPLVNVNSRQFNRLRPSVITPEPVARSRRPVVTPQPYIHNTETPEYQPITRSRRYRR